MSVKAFVIVEVVLLVIKANLIVIPIARLADMYKSAAAFIAIL